MPQVKELKNATNGRWTRRPPCFFDLSHLIEGLRVKAATDAGPVANHSRYRRHDSNDRQPRKP
jgi:hypothetical protein